MTKELIARINALAKKKREEGLTPQEAEEQKRLYSVYLENIRGQVTRQLDAVVVEGADGRRQPLKRKST